MNWTKDIKITNEDNMALMSRYPDNYFDLAIVDPPYGIGAEQGYGQANNKKIHNRIKKWDNESPELYGLFAKQHLELAL
jgi:site-specific DNA-methyltransferase (adenine-specific)